MSMISSGTRVTHAPIKKCTAMGAGGGEERGSCVNEAGEPLFYHRPPKCCDTRSALQAFEFIGFRSNTVSSLDYIRLFLAARHKRIRAQTQDCT